MTSFAPLPDRGFPPGAELLDVDAVAAAGWRIHDDFETPFATLDLARLRHNSAVMGRWVAERGVELWPHAKTAMSRELVALQLSDGAAGMTAATAAQVRVLRAWGVERVMLANQLVQPSSATWIARDLRQHPEVRFWSFVDSAEGIGRLQAIARAEGIVWEVLVEIGAPGGRTGVRDAARLADVIAALESCDRVRAIGVAVYEGAVAGDRRPESIAVVDRIAGATVEALGALIAAGVVAADGAVFSGGGSMFFDRIVIAAGALPAGTTTVIRAGCTLLHDHGLYGRNAPLVGDDVLEPALAVWGTVHSRPEPTRAFIDVGRRDISYDQGMPVVVRRWRRGTGESVQGGSIRVIALNDHHAHLELDADDLLAVGDRVELGVSHPCTTMDRWRRIPIVDGAGGVVGAIGTAF